jgi:hypothetical protein
MVKSPLDGGEVCNMNNLTVRSNSVANCRRLDLRISTGLEVFAILKGEGRFESCSGPQKYCCSVAELQKYQHRCRGKL